ncbi:MAG: hypothetical protein IJ794_05400 [Lachnospiraceae bacterium]|nr:hypothetical protein [Lachnospiraceae bacterium]
MEKLDVMKELFDLMGLPLEEEAELDEYFAADVKEMEYDRTPLFTEPAIGNFKSLIADEDAPGIYVLRAFCEFGGFSAYKTRETEILLSLILGRELTAQEKHVAKESTEICEYILFNDDGCVRSLVESTYADDEWAEDCMIPVRLALFFLYAGLDALVSFWKEFYLVTTQVRRVARIVERHYSSFLIEK